MFHRSSLWLVFAACLAVVAVAMGWISVTAVRLDRAQAEARRQVVTGLALWRIDTALTPLLTEESARPVFAYWPFLPAGGNPGRMLTPPVPAGAAIPSPLLRTPPADVILHFQYGPDRRLTSPELPTGRERAMAVPKYLSEPQIRETQKHFSELAGAVDFARLSERLPKRDLPLLEATVASLPAPGQRAVNVARRDSRQRNSPGNEYELRNDAFTLNRSVAVQSQQNTLAANNLYSPIGNSAAANTSLPMYDISGAAMTPLWVDGRLLLARRFTAGGRQYVQGCLLDWPAIRESLLDRIADLLPEASLEPAGEDRGGDESRLLAALPVRLVPGPKTDKADATASPMVLSLAAAWTCMTIAATAVALLLWGVMRLSERRAAFVSAVTHELRTPLTTFQMYAEMLAEGMVPDVEQRNRYLATLRNEAVRLTHLVENVLAYARLERGRTAGRIESIELANLIENTKDRLRAHAGQAGMTLEIEGIEEHGNVVVLANPSAVEQVLFNLVDNACKYAGAATDKRIHLAVRSRGRSAEIVVGDHGPGLSAAVRRRLFRSFSKTTEEAATSAPGVGLGLALSRRLVRDMGGDLCLDEDEEATGGAWFVLSLPKA
jgi:signal transduction histidine kinase